MNDISEGSAEIDWKAVARRTVIGTAASVAGGIAVAYLLHRLAGSAIWMEVVSAAVVAALVAAPFSCLLALKRQEVTRLKQRLTRTNSVDSLTLCLDGRVFSALVDSYQTHAGPAGQGRGAFLIIDADHFRSINERFGHAWGDEALRVIAAAIKTCLRSGDLVGRIGGEEFGVFLPGASEHNAAHVAERIRTVISETLFEPGGQQCGLTVSVGAVVFESQLAFDDLFRAADSVLSTAKTQGRNRAEIKHLWSDARAGEPSRQPVH